MLQECYKVAIDLKPFTVAGLELAPFTLFHWRTLDAFDSVFVGQSDFTPEQVAVFVAICRMRTRSEIIELLTGDFAEDLAAFTVDIAAKMTDETVNKIQEYLEYYRQQPSRTASDSAFPCAPVWGMAKSYLVEYCGFSNDEAWDCVVAEAFCEIAFHSARRNDSTLDNELTVNLKKEAASGYEQPSQEELRRRMAGIE